MITTFLLSQGVILSNFLFVAGSWRRGVGDQSEKLILLSCKLSIVLHFPVVNVLNACYLINQTPTLFYMANLLISSFWGFLVILIYGPSCSLFLFSDSDTGLIGILNLNNWDIVYQMITELGRPQSIDDHQNWSGSIVFECRMRLCL